MENKSKTVTFLTYLIMAVIVIVLSVGIFSLLKIVLINYPAIIFLSMFILFSYSAWSNHKEEQYKRERISNNPIYAESSVTNVERCDMSGDFLISHTFEYKTVLYTGVAMVKPQLRFESISVGRTIPIIFLETDPNEILIDYQALANRD